MNRQERDLHDLATSAKEIVASLKQLTRVFETLNQNLAFLAEQKKTQEQTATEYDQVVRTVKSHEERKAVGWSLEEIRDTAANFAEKVFGAEKIGSISEAQQYRTRYLSWKAALPDHAIVPAGEAYRREMERLKEADESPGDGKP